MSVPRRRRRPQSALIAAARAARAARAAMVESLEPRTLLAGVELLKDINPRTTSLTTPKNLTDVNGTLFFTAQTTLWKSDGTNAGTFQVSHDVADISNLTNFNGTLYFSSGGRLWKNTDGTAAGMTPVSTSFPSPRNIVVAGNRMFFKGGDGGGDELWTSDGTDAGTARVKDIRPGGASSDVRGITAVGNGRVFFRADDGTSGQELWTSDGTAAGTYRVKDINAGIADSGPSYLTNINGVVYFAATDGGSGFELWKSDGTEGGTVRVKDIRAGTGGSTPMMIQNVNGVAMFLATDGISGLEIWKSDGTETGTTLVKDIVAGSNGAMIQNLATAGGLLYFSAHDGTSGHELWKSDGTEAGTVRVKDLAPGAVSGNPALFTPYGNKLFFVAHNGNSGMEPWVSDGTEAGTVFLKDIWTGPSYPNPESAVVVGNKVFFAVVEELDVTDGTPAGTGRVANPTASSRFGAEARNFVKLNDNLALFTANDGTNGHELWRTDGTPAGSGMLLDMTPGFNAGTDLQQFTVINGVAYFLANGRLWKSDGTVGGTAMVHNTPLSGARLVAVGNTLFYTASTSAGSGLFKTDGTAAGTVLVRPSVQSWRPESFLDVNGTLFFVADDGGSGHELWKSDGTTDGTVRVVDIIPGVGSSGPNLLTNVNGTLYFRANDGVHGYELWKSDGTAAGTVMMKDIVAGPDGSVIQKLTAMGGALYFTADDRVHGQELWKSDGTAAGTVLLKDIFAGEHGSSASDLIVSNGVMYFRADDGVAGAELWRSDGTAAGTTLVADIISGPAGSTPSRLVAVSSGVVFDIANGNTLWRSDGTDGGTFKLYPFLMEEARVSMGDYVLTEAWSSAGNELVKVDPTGAPPPPQLLAAQDIIAPPPPSRESDVVDSPAAASTTGPATVYDATHQGDKSNTVAAGMTAMRIVYGEIFNSWMDNSVADEAIVRRIAREAFAAGQTLSLNLEHWHNDIRFDSEPEVGWSLEKMMQIIDWIHDERPTQKVGYAGQVTHGAYPAPAVGSPAYNQWHAAHERMRGLIDKVDILFPGVYTVEENVAPWFPYADGHIAEAKRYGKPVSPFMFMNYEAGYIVNHRPLPPEFWRMQLDVTRELAGSATVWGPWTDDAPWYLITRDFIADPTPLIPAPAANLAATVNQSAGTITLNWQDKSYNETGFRIERVPAASASPTFFPIGTVGRNVTTFTDTTATPGVEYLYRVVATNAGGDAAPSNVISARVRAVPTPPINVAASPISSTRARVTWEASSDDIENFIVERASGGAAFAAIATVPGTQLSYDDLNLTPGTSYIYRVRAANAIGQSDPSAEAPLATPTSNGLVAHWRFDENTSITTVLDSAGNHDGTLSPGNARNTGTLGRALETDGVDDRAIVPDAADLRFAATDSFTLAAFVHLTALPNSARTILAKANGSAARYGIALDASNRWVALGPTTTLVGPVAQTNQWTRIVVVQNGAANTRKLYVNGVEVASGAAQAANALGELWIGAGQGAAGPVQPFAGKIDDVRIYNRALDATHVGYLHVPHIVINTFGDDEWTIRLDATGTAYEFVNFDDVAFTRPADTVGSIRVNGTADSDDHLTLDFANGNVAATYGMSFHAGQGAGVDTFTLRGGASDTFTLSTAEIRHDNSNEWLTYNNAEIFQLDGPANYNVIGNLVNHRLHVTGGATATLSASQDLKELRIDAADVTLTTGGTKVIATADLEIANGARLDLRDNDLLLDPPPGGDGAAALADVYAYISSAYNWSAWDQGGLATSMTDATQRGVTTLAFAPARDVLFIEGSQTALWNGRTVTADAVLIKYTYAGDLNLDGVVDGADYGLIDNYVQFPGTTGYWNGDINFDGLIDGADYGLIDNSIQLQGETL